MSAVERRDAISKAAPSGLSPVTMVLIDGVVVGPVMRRLPATPPHGYEPDTRGSPKIKTEIVTYIIFCFSLA
jgi:hypothetical protein